MFLLNNNEKISFLKVVYSAVMFDDYIQEEEKNILESLQNEVFNLNTFQKINLETDENIANEINKITKLTPVIHLFNILYDLSRYYKRYEIASDKNKKNIYKKEYNIKITSILDKTNYKNEITKSKLFDSSLIENTIKKSTQKDSDTMDNSIIKELSEGSETFVKSTKNIFSKIFK